MTLRREIFVTVLALLVIAWNAVAVVVNLTAVGAYARLARSERQQEKE